ncbi:hypothetical protein EZI54_24060 [Marinobacter halodurans]|uniref:Uncharacterized protein n=1 Tax=Marinobacter halodurans TaxID=2528979 RepID=A0ABY1ZFD9_9GAMM|nr:hypothetical protein EZI54_24060 [Marinobacter halodurans]
MNDALYCLRFLLMILLLVEMMNQSSGTCPNFGVHFIGPGMEGNYAVIRDQQGRVLANSASVAGYGGDVPKGAVQVEVISAHKNSMAARYSQGIRNKVASAALRWAPPAMLGIFTFNTVTAVDYMLDSSTKEGAAQYVKSLTGLGYSVSKETLNKSRNQR